MNYSINIGVIGVGGFATFAVDKFVKIPGVKLIGGYDENESNANRLKTIDKSVKIYTSLTDIYTDSNIDLIYIATPPYLHYEQSKSALNAGKHVICEKPAAIELQHAIELKSIAEEKNLLFVVNLMQRYNSLFTSVSQLIESNVLGDFLHGFFENYASDQFLTKDHWFWDESKSGGIFIEHGVHFFDMFTGWLGEGQIVTSQKIHKNSSKQIWDKVQAIVKYKNGIVNFYHGFDQAKIMDRQEMRLLFEKGEITLFEWIPTQLKMTAICTEEDLHVLKQIFPAATLKILDFFEENQVVSANLKSFNFQYKINLDTGIDTQKIDKYAELVTAMFKDQVDWIKNNNHKRKVDQNNAVNSLKIAEHAEKLAIKIHD